MTISGSLEDVGLADVLQFIHLGSRTGTLRLWNGRREGSICFHKGVILSAAAPEIPRLGAALQKAGILDADKLRRALDVQRSDCPHLPLGQVLVALKLATPEEIHGAVTRQVEATVSELLAWDHGEFHFIRDEMQPIPDLARFPGDLLAGVAINTEGALLNAARVHDEVSRARGHLSPDDTVPCLQPQEVGLARDSLQATSESDRAPPQGKGLPSDPPRLQVLSGDENLIDQVRARLQDAGPRVVRVAIHDAGNSLPGDTPPVVLVDLRPGQHSPEELRSITRARPRAAIITVVDQADLLHLAGPVFEAGAWAAVPPEPTVIAACYKNLACKLGNSRGPDEFLEEGRTGLLRLRRALADLRSGLMSASMALHLMNLVSESAERGVLFLVEQSRLAALGAFGDGVQGRPLAQLTRGLALARETAGVLEEVASDGQIRAVELMRAHLPESFTRLLSRPRIDQVVALPVAGTERVIAVIYLDGGDLARPVEDLDVLELAAAQVGLAFEAELARRGTSPF